jgi:hypothetical protein
MFTRALDFIRMTSFAAKRYVSLGIKFAHSPYATSRFRLRDTGGCWLIAVLGGESVIPLFGILRSVLQWKTPKLGLWEMTICKQQDFGNGKSTPMYLETQRHDNTRDKVTLSFPRSSWFSES